jgi:hypothetical protein
MTIQVKTRNNTSGSALAEYGLIGISVLLVCMLGFMAVGTNLKDWLLGLKSDLAQHAERAHLVQMEVAQAHQNSAGDTAQDQDNGLVYLGNLRTSSTNPNALCGQDFCVNAPGLTGTSVATAGSNGDINITDSAANIYSQFAQIMKAKGADPDTVNLLTGLANKGHDIAYFQNKLRYQQSLYYAYLAATQEGSSPDSASAPVVPSEAPDNYIIMKKASNSMRKRLGEFRDLSNQLNASIDYYPEDARPLLTGAAQVVLQLGSAYRFKTLTDDTGKSRLKFIIQSNNIPIIHTNSNTICDNGGDQSQCHWRPSNGKKAN